MYKRFKPRWYHWVLRGLLDLVLLPFALLFAPYFFLVIRPIEHAIETEPLYWLNWKDVKLKTGKSTSSILYVLWSAGQPDSRFEHQLRPEDDLVRLERFLGRKRPRSTQFFSHDEVIFFEFRRKPGGSGRRNWRSRIAAMLSAPIPQQA